MCHMSDRVVFHLPDIEETEEGKSSNKVLHRSQTEPHRVSLSRASKKGFWFWGKGKSKGNRTEEPATEATDAVPACEESMASSPVLLEKTADEERRRHGVVNASLESLRLSS